MKENQNKVKELSPQEIETLRRLAQKAKNEERLKASHYLLKVMIAQAMRLNSEIDSAIYDQEEIESCADTAKYLVNYASDLSLLLSSLAEKGGSR